MILSFLFPRSFLFLFLNLFFFSSLLCLWLLFVNCFEDCGYGVQAFTFRANTKWHSLVFFAPVNVAQRNMCQSTQSIDFLFTHRALPQKLLSFHHPQLLYRNKSTKFFYLQKLVFIADYPEQLPRMGGKVSASVKGVRCRAWYSPPKQLTHLSA